MIQMIQKRARGALMLVLALGCISSYAVAEPEAEMEAFDFGIESTMLTLLHEKKIANTPIEKGYCITVGFGEEGEVSVKSKSFWAIKLESLALHLKNPKPQYLEFRNQNGDLEQTLCFAFVQGSEKEAEILLSKIKERYPKITKYNPKIFRITNTKYFNRAIPSLGQWAEDKSSAVALLSAKVTKLKQKLQIKEREIEGIRNSLLGLAGKGRTTNPSKKQRRRVAKGKKPILFKNNSKEVKPTAKPVATKPVTAKKKKQSMKIVPITKGSRVLVIKRK